MPNYLAALVSALAIFSAAPAGAEPLDSAALLAHALADKSVPAMAVLVIRHGTITEQAERGVRASDRPEPVRADDVWNIGSNGKAMTVTMIARLVERGVLSWDAPLSAMLPDLAAGMRAQYRDVTLVELLGHRAGLPSNPDEQSIEATYADPRALPVLRQEYAKLALSEAPVGPARGPFSYSNSGTVIAAAIAERATGRSYEQLMQAEVFGPLGMTAGFGPTARGQNLGHKDGQPITGARASNAPVMTPAGEIHLSMGDWAKFALDQMHGEHGKGKLLARSTYLFLHAEQGQTKAALGWGILRFPPIGPHPVLTHLGSNGFWHALIALVPDSEDGVLIAANGGDGTSAAAAQMEMAKAIMARFGSDR
jgi:CubicO group peptidase (beta-lactamase class C family)